MNKTKNASKELPIIHFETADQWEQWLAENHASAPGVWAKLGKKGSGLASMTRSEALDVALCYGWIDGQAKSYDEQSWLQKYTPRRPKSVWSKINREKVQALIDSGRMKPAGLAAIEAAKEDGRWDAAYDSPSNATVPDDLQAALDSSPEAARFFATLNSRNRYAILYKIQQAKRAETRAKRIREFVAMLERNEKIYP